jgi:hypothetical protein
MYCQACGMALSQQMRYCNRCGAQLVPASETAAIKTASEKRLDDYLDGLFWITVIGLAFVFGGMVILKRFNFSQALIIAYMALSSVAFLINFGLNFWGFLRISRQGEKVTALDSPATTSELPPADIAAAISPAPSVTENTTRSFEPVYSKRKPE